MEGINLLGVVLAVVAAAAILTAYYLPQAMGLKWQQAVIAATGQTAADLTGRIPIRMGAWLAVALVNAVVLAVLMRDLGHPDIFRGLFYGALLWLGFGATFSLDAVIFANQPILLWAINNGAYLLQLIAMGAIIGLIR